MPLTLKGWTLLTTWEGCRLSAYPDPASGDAPWTIGYGHTGAEAAGAVDRLLRGVDLTAHQRDALISFCFNVGAGALERSTLRKRLLAVESPAAVIAEELPHQRPDGSAPEPGAKCTVQDGWLH